MVEYLRGRIAGVGESWIVFEAGGAGLRVRVHDPARFRRLAGKPVVLPAWLEFSPRRLELYGFIDERERGRFAVLVAIPGIGPATALKLIPAWDTLAGAAGGAVPAVPGVGPAKTARIAKWIARRGGVAVASTAPGDLVKALKALGMTATEARVRALRAAERAPGAGIEELVRLATARGAR